MTDTDKEELKKEIMKEIIEGLRISINDEWDWDNKYHVVTLYYHGEEISRDSICIN